MPEPSIPTELNAFQNGSAYKMNFIYYSLQYCVAGQDLKITRKEVSKETPDLLAVFWESQKREYLARTESRFIEEFIEYMVFRP